MRKIKSSALFLLIGALSTGDMSGQAGGAGTKGGSTTPSAGSGGQPTVQSNPTPNAGSNSNIPAVPRPVFISGTVAMQDGSPVPQGVTIQRICNGTSRTVAYTDSKGRFSFQWGDQNMLVTDASDAGFGRRTGGTGVFGAPQSSGGANGLAMDPFGARMTNCELRANAAGFTSDLVNLFDRRTSDNPDIGMIVLHRIAGVEGSLVSATSLMAPSEAKKAYQRGLQSLQKNKPEQASKDFAKAVSLYPRYAEAWMSLGKMQLEHKATEPAQASFLNAIEADPKLVAPYVDLGLLAAQQLKWQDAAKYLDQAVKLAPAEFPRTWYADAVAHYNLKDYEVAEKSAREALRLDPRHANPRSGYLLGLVLAEKHDYAGAAAELTTYIQSSPNAPDLPEATDRLRQFQKLVDQSQASNNRP